MGGIKKSASRIKNAVRRKRAKKIVGIKFSKLKLRRSIIREGKVLNRHMGAVEIIADKVSDEVEKWAEGRAVITQEALDKTTAAKLKKYDPDIAYIYGIRGKIV